MSTFIDDVLAGRAVLDDIDDHVDRWHEDSGDTRTLAGALGMTDEQYRGWLELRITLAEVKATAERSRNP